MDITPPPEISIIIPVYNAAEYIKRCLESIINQTFANIEIICVNDGSTDNSIEIMRKIAEYDKRLKIFSGSNFGVSHARNVGLENALGKYIMFCDSDDWFELNVCESVLPLIKVYDLVLFESFIHKDEKTNRNLYVQQRYYELQKCGGGAMNSCAKIFFATVNSSVFIRVFRKNLINEFHIRFPEFLKTSEDHSFCYQYSLVSKNAYFLNIKLHNYYLHFGSTLEVYQKKWIYSNDKTHSSRLHNFILMFFILFKFLIKNRIPHKIIWPIINTILWAKLVLKWKREAKKNIF